MHQETLESETHRFREELVSAWPWGLEPLAHSAGVQILTVYIRAYLIPLSLRDDHYHSEINLILLSIVDRCPGPRCRALVLLHSTTFCSVRDT
jgi:hypothetical protein